MKFVYDFFQIDLVWKNEIPGETIALDPIQGFHRISRIGRSLMADIAPLPIIKVL